MGGSKDWAGLGSVCGGEEVFPEVCAAVWSTIIVGKVY